MILLCGIHLLHMAGTIKVILRTNFIITSRLFLIIHQIKAIISRAGQMASDLDTGARINGITLVDFQPKKSLQLGGMDPRIITRITIAVGQWNTLVISTVDTRMSLQRTITDIVHKGAKQTTVNTSA
jgi:hypothetical protein